MQQLLVRMLAKDMRHRQIRSGMSQRQLLTGYGSPSPAEGAYSTSEAMLREQVCMVDIGFSHKESYDLNFN